MEKLETKVVTNGKEYKTIGFVALLVNEVLQLTRSVLTCTMPFTS